MDQQIRVFFWKKFRSIILRLWEIELHRPSRQNYQDMLKTY